MDVNLPLSLSQLFSLTFSLSQCICGRLVYLIKVECGDLKLISAWCLQIRLLFIVASVVVWWSGLCTVAPGRVKEKKSKSARGSSSLPVMALEACASAGERDHHPGYPCPSFQPTCVSCLHYWPLRTYNFFSEIAAPVLHAEVHSKLKENVINSPYLVFICKHVQGATSGRLSECWHDQSLNGPFVGLRTAWCGLLPFGFHPTASCFEDPT